MRRGMIEVIAKLQAAARKAQADAAALEAGGAAAGGGEAAAEAEDAEAEADAEMEVAAEDAAGGPAPAGDPSKFGCSNDYPETWRWPWGCRRLHQVPTLAISVFVTALRQQAASFA